jgi:hypothetical protein
MKKYVLILLVLVLCVGLLACEKDSGNNAFWGQLGDALQQPDDDNTVRVDGDGSAVDMPLVIHAENGATLINIAKFPKCVEMVELTTENWKEYLKDYSYSYVEEKVEKDAFGTVVYTEFITHTGRRLGAGNERIHSFVDAVIELKNKTTGEMKTYQFAHSGCPISEEKEEQIDGSWYQTIPVDFSFDDYECTRIKGKLYYYNLPIDELPLATLIHPWVGDGMAIPGALYIEPGTHAADYYNIEWWFS